MVSPSHRRQVVVTLQDRLGLATRRVAESLGIARPGATTRPCARSCGGSPLTAAVLRVGRPLRLGAFGATKPKFERTGGTAMKKVSGPQVVTSREALESPLPPRIEEALGELVGAAREGLTGPRSSVHLL